jgi:hypothetical protein
LRRELPLNGAWEICELEGFDNVFDTFLDIGCFHSLEKDEYIAYAEALFRASNAGAHLFMRTFSD